MPLLIQHLLEHIKRTKDVAFSISDDALRKLNNHKWPGNVRELKNCLQLATTICMNNRIEASDILIMRRLSNSADHIKVEHRGQAIDHGISAFPVNEIANRLDFSRTGSEQDSMTRLYNDKSAVNGLTPIEIMESDYINKLLEKHQGNRKLVAAELNVSERTLYRKLNRMRLRSC
jgi:two-component system, NtrC family, response regulator AtoC